MPRRRTSLKKQRTDRRRHLYNLRVKTQLKDRLRKFKKLLQAKDLSQTKAQLAKLFSQLDKAAKKKVIHKNLANRKKSRLSRMLLKLTEVHQ